MTTSQECIMKRPIIILSLTTLTLGASAFYLMKDRSQAPEVLTQSPKITETPAPVSSQEDIQKVLTRAASIADEYQKSHPKEAADDPTFAKIQEAVKEEAAHFEEVRKEAEAASQEVYRLKDELNAAILKNTDKQAIDELNSRLEEKAIVLQQQQKSLEEAYLEVAKAYDTAIKTYL
jgi:hypothetical protein